MKKHSTKQLPEEWRKSYRYARVRAWFVPGVTGWGSSIGLVEDGFEILAEIHRGIFFHQIFRNWYFLSSFCSALDNDWAPRMPIWWFWWIITSSESIVAGWKDLESVLLLCQCHSFPMFLPLCDSQGSGSTKGSEPKSHSTIRPCLWGMNIHCTTYFVLRHRVLAPSRMVCRLLTTHCWNWIRLQHVGQVKKKPCILRGVFGIFSLSCNWWFG